MSRLFWNLNRKKDRLCHDAKYILNRKRLIVYDISITMDILSRNLDFVLVQYEYCNFLINLILFIVLWDLDNADIIFIKIRKQYVA